MGTDLFHSKETMHIDGADYLIYSLPRLQQQGYEIEKLPFSIRILLENALRNYDGFTVTKENIETILG